MITQELIDYIAHSNDEIARIFREAMQPLIDAFTDEGRQWARDFGNDHRHIMRRKIRRLVKP